MAETGEARASAASRPAKSPEAFRTISEVASELDVAPHVLRFWESKFSQIKPLKRGGRRRYYRPEDVELLRQIRSLLYVQGYTIRGVQKVLREKGARGLVAEANVEGRPNGGGAEADATPRSGASSGSLSAEQRKRVREAVDELSKLRDALRRALD